MGAMPRFSATVAQYGGAVQVHSARESRGSGTWISVQRSLPNPGAEVAGSDDFVLGVFDCDAPFDLTRDRGNGMQRMRIASGAVYAIPPDCPRFIGWTGRFCFSCVAVPRAWLGAFLGGEDTPQARRLHGVRDLVRMDAQAAALLRRLAEAAARTDEMSDLYVDSGVGFLIAALLAAPERERRLPGALPAWRLRRAETFMLRRLAEDVRVADVAAEVGLSPYHFMRGFRAATGQTPYGWLTMRRLDRAAALLEGSSMPVSEVASACGLGSPGHFAAMFRRRFGASPSEWRRGGAGR
jgi:AraC-like DNA-binding protein